MINILRTLVVVLTLATSSKYYGLLAQETIKQEYRLYTGDVTNPILVLNRDVKEDTLYLYDGKAATLSKTIFKEKDELRFRCYAMSKGLESDSDEMKVIYDKRDRKIELQALIKKAERNNRSNIIAGSKQALKIVEKSIKDDIVEWEKELKAIDTLLSTIKCPKRFERIRGKLQLEKGYLVFSPFKFLDDGELPESTDRVISYLNGTHPDSSKDIFGLKLPSKGQLKITTTGWQAGALTIPLKIYLNGESDSIPKGTNNIQTDAKFALFGGYQWGKHGYNSKGEIKTKEMKSVNLVIGASKLTLNGQNTDGRVLKETSIATLDTGLSFAFAYNKFNLFVGAGFDIPLNKVGSDWIFHGSPWVGIGIGYSILNFGL